MQEPHLAPSAAGPMNVDSPIEETFYIRVLGTPPGADFRIAVIRSDPRVRCEILILDSQGHVRDPGATGTMGTTTSRSGALRRALRGENR